MDSTPEHDFVAVCKSPNNEQHNLKTENEKELQKHNQVVNDSHFRRGIIYGRLFILKWSKQI